MQIKNECANRTFDGESLIMIPYSITTTAATPSNLREKSKANFRSAREF